MGGGSTKFKIIIHYLSLLLSKESINTSFKQFGDLFVILQ